MADPEYRPNQQEQQVDRTPVFNGANCLVCVDVPAILSGASTEWAGRYAHNHSTPDLTDRDLIDAIIAAIDAALKTKCPDRAVKLQLLFHHGGGYVESKSGRRRVSHAALLESVFSILARRASNRITKVYLAGCTSHDYKDLVNGAFQLPGVTHVVTVDNTIALACGTIEGLGWDDKLNQPTFEPGKVRIIVWTKENNTQIAHVPSEEVQKDERFNPTSNTIEKKSQPPTGPCPTISPISGSGQRRISYYDTAADAAAAAAALADPDAQIEAQQALIKFTCPNPGCLHKRLGPVTVTKVKSYGTRTSFGAVIASVFYWSAKYEGVVNYDWNSSVICE